MSKWEILLPVKYLCKNKCLSFWILCFDQFHVRFRVFVCSSSEFYFLSGLRVPTVAVHAVPCGLGALQNQDPTRQAEVLQVHLDTTWDQMRLQGRSSHRRWCPCAPSPPRRAACPEFTWTCDTDCSFEERMNVLTWCVTSHRLQRPPLVSASCLTRVSIANQTTASSHAGLVKRRN